MSKEKAWKTVYDLCCDGAWENNYYAFSVAGSKKKWDSAVYSYRTGKVVISRLVDCGGKAVGILGMRYTFRYVPKHLLVTYLHSRSS